QCGAAAGQQFFARPFRGRPIQDRHRALLRDLVRTVRRLRPAAEPAAAGIPVSYRPSVVSVISHMPDLPLSNLRVLLGVSGGIAAYKACELVRRLRDAGAEVRVVLTENAARFVTPLTFQALSGQPVRSGLWDEAAEMAMGHIELARWAERIVIA